MEKLKALRKSKGLSLRKLAAQVKVSASMLSMIEKGKRLPSLPALYRIAEFFGVQLWDICDPVQGCPSGCAPAAAADLCDEPPITWGALT